MNAKIKVNYLFIILFFISIFFLCTFHAFSLKRIFLEARLYFLSISAIQILLEIGFFLLVGLFLKKSRSPWVYRIYSGSLFLLLLFHMTDYIMLRLMDQSLGSSLKIFMTLNLSHLLAALRAMNLNLQISIIIILSIVLTPSLGIFVYYLLEKITIKKPFHLSFKKCLFSTFSLIILFLSFDLFFQPIVKNEQYTKIKKALPFGKTFLSPNFPIVALRKVYKEKQPFEINNLLIPKKKNLPNIYLFIVETFRKDYLTNNITPFLYQFQEKSCKLTHTFANANATPLSWYSIFHANLPYNWQTTLDNTKQEGTLPLNLLKKKGYKIRLYSSADLHYFHMGENIFGKNFSLCDKKKEFFELEKNSPWKRDSNVISALNTDLQNKDHHKNTLFIVFLDSPHSEYSYPDFLEGTFGKTVDRINYLSVDLEHDLEHLKNRYKTSLYYIDTLFQSFFETLSKTDHHEDAMICITGDHGEEFLEDGALFHGSHLNDAQTSVPLLIKLGKKENITTTISSHIDIFPSFLHHINIIPTKEIFDGTSIELKTRDPYSLTIQQNGTSKPEVFAINNGQNRIIARFIDEKNIELISIDDSKEKTLTEVINKQL